MEGVVETGLTEDVALSILEDEENFWAVVKELAEDEDWLGNPQGDSPDYRRDGVRVRP